MPSASLPVWMKPLASRSRQPSSQSVLGSAPIITKMLPTLRVSLSPVSRLVQVDRPKTVVAFQRRDLGPGVERDLRRLPDALHEIVGHGGGEAACAHQHVDVSGRSRQEHRRLAGRVAAANNNHLFAAAELRLHSGCGVVDALTFELDVVRHIQLSVAGAGGDDDHTGRDRLIVVEADPVELFGAVDAGDIARDRKPRSKLLRLDLRATGQRLAGDPGRETEVVFDLRRCASLAARR